MKKRIFITNCEGNITKTNNTLELIKHFVPEGDRVLDTINNYCTINANITHKKDVRYAQPLKLVLPFLLAFGANNKNVEEYSLECLVLRDHAKEVLAYVKNVSNAYIFSTSYEHHLRAICQEIGFPLENVLSTKVNLDKIHLNDKEKANLKSIAWEIGGMTPLNIPPNAQSIKDFSSQDQLTIKRLDRLFWNEVARGGCKPIFNEVYVIGEADKLSTVQTVANSLSSRLDEVMYVGNAASDTAPMKLVHSSSGFVVSLAGEAGTVRNSGVALLTDDYAPIGIFADLFLRFGQTEAARVVGNFDKNSLWMSAAAPEMLNLMLDQNVNWPTVYAVSDFSAETVVKKVEEYRKAPQATRQKTEKTKKNPTQTEDKKTSQKQVTPKPAPKKVEVKKNTKAKK